MAATEDDTLLPFSLPNLCKKKITAAFDGGQISSDGGVLLLAGAHKRLGLIDALSALIPDDRDPAQITHSMADILRERILAIACGYPDGNDLNDLREDPAFKMACGRLPESGVDLASQPTISRLENVPDLRALIRTSHGMVKLWCGSYRKAPKSIILDIDDTADTVLGHQQLSLFNAHYDERCFSPIHIYDAETGHCVVTILRPGKTPDGREVRAHLRRLVRSIRRHRPKTLITIQADSHGACPRAGGGPEGSHGVVRTERYPLHLRPWPNKILAEQAFAKLDECCVRRAESKPDAKGRREKVRDYTETTYRAKSWPCSRRVVALIEVTEKGADVRYVVTNLTKGIPEWLYNGLYCARGQAENLIKRPKSQLASDRTSRRSSFTNQMRLIPHTAAYWLMRTVRDAIPRPQALASGEFSTIRLRLLKVAVRIKETTSRVRLAFAANCPDAELFRDLFRSLTPRPT